MILLENYLLLGTFGFSPVLPTENQRMSKGHEECPLIIFVEFIFLMSLDHLLVWKIVEMEHQIQRSA